MIHDRLLEHCLSKKGAYLDYPFGPESVCVKVRRRLFAQLFFLKGIPMITLNCDRMTGEFYRSIYPEAVRRGYHCPPVQQPYFNTVNLHSGIPMEELLEMIDHSYSFVTGKLPKKIQRELEEEG